MHSDIQPRLWPTALIPMSPARPVALLYPSAYVRPAISLTLLANAFWSMSASKIASLYVCSDFGGNRTSSFLSGAAYRQISIL